MPRPGWVKQGLPAPTHMLQQGFSPLLRTAGLSIRPQAIRVVLCPPWLDRRPPPPRAPPMRPPPQVLTHPLMKQGTGSPVLSWLSHVEQTP